MGQMTSEKREWGNAWIIIFVMTLVLLSYCANKCGKGTSPHSGVDAFVMSQVFIKKLLKAPSTADFAPVTESSVEKIGQNSYRVKSYVDVQNSFGDRLRNYYTCELEYIGNKNWKLINYNLSHPI